MLLIREVMNCNPGKARPMVEKALAMSKLMEKSGMGRMRVLTDVVAEGYWTVIMEFEIASLTDLDKMMSGRGQSKALQKKFETIMKGYHDLVRGGRREIYTIEG